MIPAITRFVRFSLTALLVGALYASPAFAQATGDLEAFRQRLATFLQELEEVHVLTGVHPPGEPSAGEAAAPDLATLTYEDLAKLMQSYPNDPKFWDAPKKLLIMLKRVAPSAFNTPGVSTPVSRGRQMMTALARWPDRSARRSRLSDEEVSVLMRSYAAGRPAQRAPQTVLAALHQSYRVDDDVFGRADGLDIVRRAPLARSGSASLDSGVTLTTVAAAEATADPVACPAGFDYEALWVARDAEMVADIAMEIIPEDFVTSPAYIVAAVAWGALKVTLFVVEQIYERWDDCESANVFAQVDAPISSRATQTSVDSLHSGLSSVQSSVSGIQSSVSEIGGVVVNESATLQANIAVFQAVLGAQSVTTTQTVNALLGKIDNLAATSASGDAVSQLTGKVNANGQAVSQLSAMVSATVPRTLGPSGAITVYTEPNFGGTSAVFRGDETGNTLKCIGAPYMHFFFGIKSIRVPAGTSVTFYAACNYQGDSKTFTADDTDLSGDKLQINPGWMEFPAASMRIVQTELTTLERIASQASLDTLNSKVDALDLSGSGALAAKVDAVHAAVSGANFSGLDASVSSRASQASVDALASTIATVNSSVAAINLSKLDVAVSSRASQASVDALASSIAGVGDSVGGIDLSKLDVGVSTRATQTAVDAVQSSVADVQRELTTRTDGLGAALTTRASQASVDQVAASLAAKATQGSLDAATANILATLQQRFDALALHVATQPLHLQVIELASRDRYLVYVTDAGRAVGGARVSKVQALDQHPKKGASITDITSTVTVTEIAPGVLEVRVPKNEKLEGLIVSVVHGEGPAARAASTVAREMKRGI
jgi:hypothetical protein